jgi:hypothetical protein
VRGVARYTLAVAQVRRDQVAVGAALGVSSNTSWSTHRVENLGIQRVCNSQNRLLVHVREDAVVVVWGVCLPQS